VTELLACYLILGFLAALAQSRLKLGTLLRNTLLWPLMIPAMLRADPSPVDPPGLQSWRERVTLALGSLEAALRRSDALSDAGVAPRLLAEPRAQLLEVARREAELALALSDPQFDVDALERALREGPEHLRSAHQQRLDHALRLTQARAALEQRLEEGLAGVMGLTAQLHLARAVGAPIGSLVDGLAEVGRAVASLEEAELVGASLTLPDLEPADRPARSPHPVALLDPELLAEPANERVVDAVPVEWPDGIVPPPPQLPTVQQGVPTSTQRAASGTRRFEDRFLSGHRREIILTVVGLALFSLARTLLVGAGAEQTAALFIGLPTLFAVLVALLPPARSMTGLLLRLTTLALMVSGVLLAEGFICVLMAAPLFLGVAVVAGVLLDLLRTRGPVVRVVAIAPLLLLSLEGLWSPLDAHRDERVEVVRTVPISAAAVWDSLGAKPNVLRQLPLPLRLGFPIPLATAGGGLSPGDRHAVRLGGGEGVPGNLVFEVVEAVPGRVVFRALSDTSHIAHWLRWERAVVTWEPVGEGSSSVRWSIEWKRDLEPYFWFAWVQRLAMRQVAGFLIEGLTVSPQRAGGDDAR
jgi:hypothetical protein